MEQPLMDLILLDQQLDKQRLDQQQLQLIHLAKPQLLALLMLPLPVH
jgi:hypothetical protein